jgi:hypothetical protein
LSYIISYWLASDLFLLSTLEEQNLLFATIREFHYPSSMLPVIAERSHVNRVIRFGEAALTLEPALFEVTLIGA